MARWIVNSVIGGGRFRGAQTTEPSFASRPTWTNAKHVGVARTAHDLLVLVVDRKVPVWLSRTYYRKFSAHAHRPPPPVLEQVLPARIQYGSARRGCPQFL